MDDGVGTFEVRGVGGRVEDVAFLPGYGARPGWRGRRGGYRGPVGVAGASVRTYEVTFKGYGVNGRTIWRLQPTRDALRLCICGSLGTVSFSSRQRDTQGEENTEEPIPATYHELLLRRLCHWGRVWVWKTNWRFHEPELRVLTSLHQRRAAGMARQACDPRPPTASTFHASTFLFQIDTLVCCSV